MSEPRSNGWTEWSKFVLKELERLAEGFENILDRLNKIDNRLTIIEVKAAFIGAIAGALGMVLTHFVLALLRMKMGG